MEEEKTAKKIALFNHKGGVSKTTTTFNLGWMLAQKGKTVILVDADPQCTLTGMVLGYQNIVQLEEFYDVHPERNIRSALAPAFEARPVPIKPVECVQVTRQEGLYLLPGHIRLTDYETTLGLSQELSNSISALQNLPGAIAFLLEKTAAKYQADYVLLDMNPSLSSINQNVLMISDYAIVPTSPDYFSALAIDSLATVLPRWSAWAERASSLPILKDSVYPFPKPTIKFLGTIVQNYRQRAGRPTRSYQQWIDKIHSKVRDKLVPALEQHHMLLPENTYRLNHIEDYCLAVVPDFNSLVALSQEYGTPVFALERGQIQQAGVVLENTEKQQAKITTIISDLADKVIGLTSDAIST